MRLYRAVGVMTGTSLDGIDLAVVETDGYSFVNVCETASFAFPDDIKGLLKSSVIRALAHGKPTDSDPIINNASRILTELCSDKIELLLKKIPPVDLIGFHGQTVLHNPDKKITWQIGLPHLMANRLALPVVFNFRQKDIDYGGQGAPLVPLYHLALLKKAKIERPAMIINLGGVANITWCHGDRIYAFDTGPGGGLIDTWVSENAGVPYDVDGALARIGQIDQEALAQMRSHPFFAKIPPKSMDRYDISMDSVKDLSLADGAATLTALTAWSVREALKFVPEVPEIIFVAGGGRHNDTLMKMLYDSFPDVQFLSPEFLNSTSDTMEAEAFGYLAVRSYKDLPLSLPTTTGVSQPQTGGDLIQPQFAEEAGI